MKVFENIFVPKILKPGEINKHKPCIKIILFMLDFNLFHLVLKFLGQKYFQKLSFFILKSENDLN